MPWNKEDLIMALFNLQLANCLKV